MVRFFQLISFCGLSGLLLSGCGNSLTDSVDIELDPVEQVARVKAKMSDGLEINLDGEFLFADGYGTISFEPATKDSPAKMVIEFDVGRIVEENVDLAQFGVVTQLPNGAALPVSMTPPLIAIPVIENGSVRVTVVTTLYPELQAGAIIEIDAIQEGNFPKGISICQNYRDDDGYAYASTCLYGPGENVSGGLFFGGNFGDVLGWGEPDEPQPEPLLGDNGLKAFSAMSLAPATSNKLEVYETVSKKSQVWTESRNGKNKDKLSSKHIERVKKILKAK